MESEATEKGNGLKWWHFVMWRNSVNLRGLIGVVEMQDKAVY